MKCMIMHYSESHALRTNKVVRNHSGRSTTALLRVARAGAAVAINHCAIFRQALFHGSLSTECNFCRQCSRAPTPAIESPRRLLPALEEQQEQKNIVQLVLSRAHEQ